MIARYMGKLRQVNNVQYENYRKNGYWYSCEICLSNEGVDNKKSFKKYGRSYHHQEKIDDMTTCRNDMQGHYWAERPKDRIGAPQHEFLHFKMQTLLEESMRKDIPTQFE